MEQATKLETVPFCHLVVAILVVLQVKIVFLLSSMPSMWIWGDEMLYYMTAYDFLHLGETGVPHPYFLNYPPLTSLLLIPIHLFGASGELGYHLSLLILNVVQAAGVVAACLTIYEIFGFRSRLLAILLMVGPTAYVGFYLMSEAPFIALYLWLLYFYVRQLKTGETRHAAAVGLLIGLMILTRKNGIGVVGSVAVMMVVEALRPGVKERFRKVLKGRFREILKQGEKGSLWETLRLHSLSILIALGIAFSWRLILTYGLEAKYGHYGMVGYLKHGLLPALDNVRTFLVFTRKMLANLGYVSLSTYGICVPTILWYCLAPGAGEGDLARPRGLVRRLMIHVTVFMLFAAFAAALMMFINKDIPNTRYLMYGRYVEYSSPLLVAVTFGLFATDSRLGQRSRGALVFLAGALSVAFSVIIPVKFFTNQSGASNNMGICWLISLSGESVAAAVTLGPVVAIAFALLLTSPRFSEIRELRFLAWVLFFALALFNVTGSARLVSSKSQKFHEVFGSHSNFVKKNPELFKDGIFVDVMSVAKGHRRDKLLTHKLLAEHVDRVIVGKHLTSYLGKIPVMSQAELEGYEVLFEAEGFVNKIYGVR